MLVLTRLTGQRIVLSGGPLSSPITVKVVDVRDGCRVRLGIEAPAEIDVDREEIHLLKEADRNGRQDAKPV